MTGWQDQCCQVGATASQLFVASYLARLEPIHLSTQHEFTQHAHVHACAYACTHALMHALTHARVHVHECMRMQTCTHTCTHAHMHTCARMCISQTHGCVYGAGRWHRRCRQLCWACGECYTAMTPRATQYCRCCRRPHRCCWLAGWLAS